MAEKLVTTSEVIDKLGGVGAIAAITGRKYSAAHNWKSFETFPANTFLVLQQALRERGYEAPASLWGMVKREEDSAA